jgi:hypothetical protein
MLWVVRTVVPEVPPSVYCVVSSDLWCLCQPAQGSCSWCRLAFLWTVEGSVMEREAWKPEGNGETVNLCDFFLQLPYKTRPSSHTLPNDLSSEYGTTCTYPCIHSEECISPDAMKRAKQRDFKMSVFWDLAPCSLVVVDRCLRGAYCLHHQGDDDWPELRGSTLLWNISLLQRDYKAIDISQKVVVLTALRTWNLTEKEGLFLKRNHWVIKKWSHNHVICLCALLEIMD